MASYRVEVSATAEKQLRKLRADDQLRILRAVQALAAEPRPPGCRKSPTSESTRRESLQ